MTVSPDFSGYLSAIATTYGQWWELYTLTDAIQLTVRTAQPRQTEPSPESGERLPEPIEQFPILEGIRKYAADHDHVLLSGKPGSDKSTALRRLLLDEADRALRGETDSIPVLVELRGGKAIATLIQDTLRRHRLKLTVEQIDDLLFDSKLLLLVDGVNEVASVELLRNLEDFRANNPTTPMIFTTRDLGLGGDLGIAKKLEMQPLNEPQMQEFVYKYLPEQGADLLRQLQHRLRELCETPLLLKMLCGVFGYVQQIPQNKGELFRGFDRDYDQFKRIETISADLRRWKSELLQHLAFRMMQGKEATQPLLQIARSEAEKILEDLLRDRVTSPGEKAKAWLEDLLEHHLLQVVGDRTQIEFHHQLFQEYYAAEYLLHQLPELLKDERRFQKEYLNLLKWTEAIALMLGLVEDEGQAVRVVELAIKADLMSGARLAGEVKREFQKKTVELVTLLDVPHWLKVQLWGLTRSDLVILRLSEAIENNDYFVCDGAISALGAIGTDAAIPVLLKALATVENPFSHNKAAVALEDISLNVIIPVLLKVIEENEDAIIRSQAVELLGNTSIDIATSALLKALEDEEFIVRKKAVMALGKIGTDAAIPALIKALEDKNAAVREEVVEALKIIDADADAAIPALIKALEDENASVRWRAALTLGKIGTDAAIPALIRALEDENASVRGKVAEALGKIGTDVVIPALIKALEDENTAVREEVAKALGKIKKIGSVIPLLFNQITTRSGRQALRAISAIQDYCKFYNHEIFQASEALPSEIPSQSSPSLIVQGDYIVGDKVEGDKAMGDKVTGDKNIHNVETVGNLNTGTVNIQGTQIGSQNNLDGKA